MRYEETRDGWQHGGTELRGEHTSAGPERSPTCRPHQVAARRRHGPKRSLHTDTHPLAASASGHRAACAAAAPISAGMMVVALMLQGAVAVYLQRPMGARRPGREPGRRSAQGPGKAVAGGRAARRLRARGAARAAGSPRAARPQPRLDALPQLLAVLVAVGKQLAHGHSGWVWRRGWRARARRSPRGGRGASLGEDARAPRRRV